MRTAQQHWFIILFAISLLQMLYSCPLMPEDSLVKLPQVGYNRDVLGDQLEDMR